MASSGNCADIHAPPEPFAQRLLQTLGETFGNRIETRKQGAGAMVISREVEQFHRRSRCRRHLSGAMQQGRDLFLRQNVPDHCHDLPLLHHEMGEIDLRDAVALGPLGQDRPHLRQYCFPELLLTLPIAQMLVILTTEQHQ